MCIEGQGRWSLKALSGFREGVAASRRFGTLVAALSGDGDGDGFTVQEPWQKGE